MDLMPCAPKSISCPNCGGFVRKWPVQKGRLKDKFLCEAKLPSCFVSGQVENGRSRRIRENGKNRFHCFLCDYSICLECVERRLERRKKFESVQLEDLPKANSSYYDAIYKV